MILQHCNKLKIMRLIFYSKLFNIKPNQFIKSRQHQNYNMFLCKSENKWKQHY